MNGTHDRPIGPRGDLAPIAVARLGAVANLRAVALVALALFAASATACGVPDAFVPRSQPPGRPHDGLLDDRELQEIVELQVRRDGPSLARLLSHPRPRVRARAAYALGSVQDASAVPRLVRALEDPVAAVRTDAAFALGQISDSALSASASGPALARALTEETDPASRRAMIEALGKIGGLSQIDRLARVVDPDREADLVLALGRALVRGVPSDEALDRLVRSLAHADGDVRRNSAWAFGRAGAGRFWDARHQDVRLALSSYAVDDGAGAHLLKALGTSDDGSAEPMYLEWLANSPDWRSRQVAVEAIGRDASGHDPDVVAAVLSALADPSIQVSTSAAEFLAAQPRPESIQEALLGHVGDHPEDWQSATPIMALMARTGRSDVVVPWLRELDVANASRMAAALRVLGYLAGEEAVRELARLAGSPRAQIARAAYRELEGRWRADRSRVEVRSIYHELFRELVEVGNPVLRDDIGDVLADPAFASTDGDGGSPDVAPGGIAVSPEAAAPAATRLRRPAVPPSPDWSRLRALGAFPRLVLETERGTVVLALATEEAPLTVQVITGLAESGRYDGVPFHRVIGNFVAQAGDLSLGNDPGGPPVRLLGELTRIPYVRGVIGMARTAEKDSEGSQFFITHTMQPHLDAAYSAFGWVIEGMDVVDRIRVGDRVIAARVEVTR
ncbi:MAG TPA: peptidylprolyl isomerase [Longimicrobiales bacterium]